MKRFILVGWLLLGGLLIAQGQNFKYKWERVPMDTTWMGDGTSKVEQIIAKYQPGMAELMEIVGYTSEEMDKGQPESGLSNLAADALLFAAEPLLDDDDAAFSLTNFGGIRSELPKGAIRKYDIFSVFPFDNSVVVVELPGYRVREILNLFIKWGRFEALGGVEIEVKGKKLTKCYIGGKRLEDDETYKLVTIDFLLDGGDSLNLKKDAKDIERTEIFVREGVERYVKYMADKGHIFSNQPDGRIVVKK